MINLNLFKENESISNKFEKMMELVVRNNELKE